ncbi:hypothetical protein PGT21_000204 [Puccinia graminis f. sp. tritici]|uniref:Uncharacterized protein n=1 Tax=Puccinia graminis f. sp. tritici TaxID=56615 RepID=A0A5B0QSC2_PUCGR|nr:hypothetical protein PGT21_000204 [Puccinia graminis f. sp. tritici]
MSSSTLSPPWMKNKKAGNLPIFRTRIDKTLDMDEPIYQQPKQQESIYQQPTTPNNTVLIEQPGLFYNGHHFMQFLRQYEMKADSLNATKYDQALQIGRFVRTEELKCQIESMDGYEECDWDILRASMIELWGDKYEIWYTTTDLVNLSEEFSRDNKTKQLRSRQDALVLFISAFPQELQRNIKQNLNQNGQLPQAPDGSRLPPLWEHLTEAAGVEIKLKELAKELESLKQQLQESQSPVICNTPHPLSQLEPRTDYTEPATEYMQPQTDYTEPATEYTEPATEYTELAKEYTEPATDYTELVKDYTEPEANYTELTIADTEKSMDVTIPVASMHMTEPVTTTQLLDLKNGKRHQ